MQTDSKRALQWILTGTLRRRQSRSIGPAVVEKQPSGQLGRVPVQLFDHVGVDVARDLDGAVAEAAGHSDEVDTGPQAIGGMTVPEGMEGRPALRAADWKA